MTGDGRVGIGAGSIYAVDINPGRVRMVRESADAQGVGGMVHTLATDLRVLAEAGVLGGGVEADRVLLDAPCSGLGVLSKRADLRWRRGAEGVRELAHLQDELLHAAGGMVRVGGVLVYSTCSIEEEENEERIRFFLATHAVRPSHRDAFFFSFFFGVFLIEKEGGNGSKGRWK